MVASMTSANLDDSGNLGAERQLVVMIPAFNEAGSIEGAVRNIKSLTSRLHALGCALTLVVVDDGSIDATATIAAAAGADRIVSHRRNKGLGAAVRTGLENAAAARADLFVKIDADLQHNAEDIAHIIEPILAGNADIVYGERFSKIGYRMPILRRLGNIAFRALMRRLTKWPIKDSQPGIFAVSSDYLDVFDVPGDYNYTQQILLDAYLKGMRFQHVSVHFEKRLAGRSFVSLLYPFKVLPQIVLVIAMSRPMRIFGTCGLIFLLVGVGVFAFEICEWLLGAAPKPVVNVNLVLGFSLFGVQMLFFGILAKLVVLTRPQRTFPPFDQTRRLR